MTDEINKTAKWMAFAADLDGASLVNFVCHAQRETTLLIAGLAIEEDSIRYHTIQTQLNDSDIRLRIGRIELERRLSPA